MSEPRTAAGRSLLDGMTQFADEFGPTKAAREAITVLVAAHVLAIEAEALEKAASRIEALPVLTIAVDRQMLPGVPPEGVFQMPPATITVTNAPHDGPGLIDRFLVLAALSAEGEK